MTFAEMLAALNIKLDDSGNVLALAATKQTSLNNAWRQLYEDMNRLCGNHNVKTKTLTVLADTQEYDLDSDFGKVYGKAYRTVAGDRKEFEMLDYTEHDEDANDSGDPDYFYIYGQYSVITSGGVATTKYAKIGFLPKPDSAFTAYLDYIPTCPVMVGDSDVPPLAPEYHDLIVLDAALELLETKRPEIYNMLMARREKMYARFEKWCADRGQKTPRSFYDVMMPG